METQEFETPSGHRVVRFYNVNDIKSGYKNLRNWYPALLLDSEFKLCCADDDEYKEALQSNGYKKLLIPTGKKALAEVLYLFYFFILFYFYFIFILFFFYFYFENDLNFILMSRFCFISDHSKTQCAFDGIWYRRHYC